jgi:acyl-CoA thioesterase
MTPKDRAEKSAAAMSSGHGASSWVGMELISVDEGTSEMGLTVEKHHANGHGMCHGGITFTLADSAFAFACNSRNQATVAQHNSISYLAPAMIGDRLTARAHEVHLQGRSGIYDVKVTNQNNTLIAEFRGHSRSIKGTLFEE